MNSNQSQQPQNENGNRTHQSIEILVEMIQSPSVEIEYVVDVMKQIPGLKDALVERANSPEFALRNQISCVEHAIAVLGLRRTEETIKAVDTNIRRSSLSLSSPHFMTHIRQDQSNATKAN